MSGDEGGGRSLWPVWPSHRRAGGETRGEPPLGSWCGQVQEPALGRSCLTQARSASRRWTSPSLATNGMCNPNTEPQRHGG